MGRAAAVWSIAGAWRQTRSGSSPASVRTISPRTIVRRLSPAQQQLVAIARALSMNARLLVLDEPTASLGSSEAERLFAVLQDLRAGGTAIVYVSHRLKEIEALADRAVVLRDGRNAGVLHRGEITRDRLVRLMVGRAIEGGIARPGDGRTAHARRGCTSTASARVAIPRRGLADRQSGRGARHCRPDRRGTL